MSNHRIYTVIVTYNAMQWIDRCLDSLRHSSIPSEVIIVDNGSQDKTTAHIERHYPEMHLIAQNRNLGFGQANNIGIREALAQGATHVLILNQDAWIDTNMLEALLVYDDGNSLLSPVHLNGSGDRIDANFERNTIKKSQEYSRYKQEQAQGKTGRYATKQINAACWLLPRTILEEIGGFSPLFFHYAEDNDYMQRLQFHGKGVYFVSGIYCYHDREHASPKLPSKQSIYQQLVLRAVDINHSLCRCWWMRMRYGIAVWHTAIAEHRLRDIHCYFQAKRLFCCRYKEIKQNRHIIQTRGAHWLQ